MRLSEYPDRGETEEQAAERTRFAMIGESIRLGNRADITPEALEWYVDRAGRLDAQARRARHLLADLGAVMQPPS